MSRNYGTVEAERSKPTRRRKREFFSLHCCASADLVELHQGDTDVYIIMSPAAALALSALLRVAAREARRLAPRYRP